MKAEISGYTFAGENLLPLILELQVKNNAMMKTLISWMCEERTESPADYTALFADINLEFRSRAEELVQQLYERKGEINLREILDNSGECHE